ncbi:hypothetical protein [Pseudomonas viridiflava]|uniref:hypothetical protein n=1 Tax=Pseudomonas viridiflava TaxID=33069 RepID=UPI001F154D79|nr:hypothetical protein [Pseudomonas viridiflava]
MAAKKPPHLLRTSEIERFEQNLANWLKLAPAEAMYHRFQGVLERQIVTLQICGVITSQGAAKLHIRMSESRRKKTMTILVRNPEA